MVDTEFIEFIEKYESMVKFLNDIKTVCRNRKSESTLFDVAGYSHYENVVSNFLQFFLTPTETHGLGDLWLRSLIQCYKRKLPVNSVDENSFLDYGEVSEVFREYATETDKRIDLLVITEKYPIAIENKIYSGVSNPFDAYHNTVKNGWCNEDIEPVEILLSIRDEGNQIEDNYKFINILYKDYLQEVLQESGEYLLHADPKWIIMMKDFINNIANLAGGTAEMEINSEWNDFLRKQNDVLSKIYKYVKEDVDLKKEWLLDIQRQIDDAYSPGIYGKSGYSGFMSIYMDFPKNASTYVLEPYFCKDPNATGDFGEMGYFYICIWDRKKKSNLKEIKTWFQDDYSNSLIAQNGGWGNCLLLAKKSFAEKLEQQSIAEELNSIAQKLQNYQN